MQDKMKYVCISIYIYILFFFEDGHVDNVNSVVETSSMEML